MKCSALVLAAIVLLASPRLWAEDAPSETASKSPAIQLLDAAGRPAVSNCIVDTHVGLPSKWTEPWTGYRQRDGLVPLEKLSAGTHWLLAAGEFEQRTVFRIQMPVSEAVVKQRLRTSTPWVKRDLPVTTKAIVDERGDAIVVEVKNTTNENVEYSWADVSLTTEIDRQMMRVQSPEWLADRRPDSAFIEPGKSVRLKLRWSEWVQRGLWSSRSSETISEPAMPEPVPGKLWIRVWWGNGSTLPLLVTHPTRGLLDTRSRQPRPVQWQFRGGSEGQPLPQMSVTVYTASGAPYAKAFQGLTDEHGVFAAELRPGRYSLVLDADRELPYLPIPIDPQLRGHRDCVTLEVKDQPDLQRLEVGLIRACELTLRAVDDETGRGIPGVTFYTANDLAEIWQEDIKGDNVGARAANKRTNAEGYFRSLVGPRLGYTYCLETVPPGYRLVEGARAEVTLETPLGKDRVEHVFRLRK